MRQRDGIRGPKRPRAARSSRGLPSPRFGASRRDTIELALEQAPGRDGVCQVVDPPPQHHVDPRAGRRPTGDRTQNPPRRVVDRWGHEARVVVVARASSFFWRLPPRHQELVGVARPAANAAAVSLDNARLERASRCLRKEPQPAAFTRSRPTARPARTRRGCAGRGRVRHAAPPCVRATIRSTPAAGAPRLRTRCAPAPWRCRR